MQLIIILLCASAFVEALELMVEKVDIEYHNPQYFNSVNFTMRKLRRNSPYFINLYIDTKIVLGNNLMIKWSVYEIIGGHHVLTPISLEYGLCDFLYKDPYIGKMIASQMKNWKCPFSVGILKFENLEYNMTNIPYIPFTFSSLYVRIFTVVEGFMNKVNLALRWKFHFALKQKLQDKYRKEKNK